MADTSLPDGYTLDASAAPAASAATALPSGYSLDAPSPPTGADAAIGNVLTGLQSGVGNLIGAPHAISSMVGNIAQGIGVDHPVADWVAQNTPPAADVNNWLYRQSGKAENAVGAAAPTPYQPQTGGGKIVQGALGAAVPSLVGGGGMGALIARLSAGLGGGGASTAYGMARPNDYWGQLATGLAGALAGGGIGGGASGLASTARQAISPTGPAERAVATQLANTSGQSGAALASTIDQNLPGWTSGTKPTLGAVTGDSGIQNLTYNDQAAAARAGNPIYQTNAGITNAAQRGAIAGVTPDTATTMRNLIADRDAAVNAIPPGLTSQQAGQQFRQNLQDVYDQRFAARKAGGSAFNALQNSPARINLQPVMDYATEQAAKNAGALGDAYNAALGQFKSGTGITLDTAPFANSVLKGLGDTAASYPKGSAGAYAVNDVKGRLEDQLTQQVPEIAQARAQWAQNSRPLDVFETKPFAQVLATDRFGRSYAMPNDAVAQTFLRGNGSADSLDALNGIFEEPAAAKQALGDFMAGQVRQAALNSDGSINTAAMQRVLQPYQRALIRFPDLQKQFTTATGAQQALEQQDAYAHLYDTFSHGLGTMQTDAAGNPMYSGAQFDRAVQQNQPLIAQAYGPQGAAVVNQVNDELSRISQTAYAKVPGQSGTPQVLGGASHGGGGWLGQLAGSLGGVMIEHMFEGSHGFAGAYIGSKLGEAVQGAFHGGQGFQTAIDTIRRQALTDPAFAQSLLQKYNPSGPTLASSRAVGYVMHRIPGVAAGLTGPLAGLASNASPSAQ